MGITAVAATVPHAQVTPRLAVAIPVEDTARRILATARPAVDTPAGAAATEVAEVEAAIMVVAAVDPAAAAPMVAAEVTLADTDDNREIHPA